MFQYLKVVLRIGSVKESTSKMVRVRQGKYMVLVSFLFVAMSFVESLEKEWHKAGLDMIELRQHNHSPRDCGQFTNHKRNKLSEGNSLLLFCMLYVDDGTFNFTTIE